MGGGRIDALYVALHDNPDDSEGLLASQGVPVLSSRKDVIERLKPQLRDMAAASGRTIRLVKFAVRRSSTRCCRRWAAPSRSVGGTAAGLREAGLRAGLLRAFKRLRSPLPSGRAAARANG